MKGKPLSIRKVFAIVVAALVLAGCGTPAPRPQAPAPVGDQSPTQAPPTPQNASHGAFAFTADGGGTGVLDLPGAVVPEIEELRELVGGEPVEYVTVTVDNREGTIPVNMYEVQVFDPEGRQYTYTGAAAYIWDMQRKLPEGTPAGVYNKYVDLHNQYIDDAAPREVKDFVLVGGPVPERIAGVTVYATGGFNPVQAEPVK